MAIKAVTCYEVSCDHCHKDFGTGDYDSIHYQSAEDAIGASHDYDWVTIKAGEYTENEMLICEDCRSTVQHTCKYESDDTCGLCWEDKPEEEAQ